VAEVIIIGAGLTGLSAAYHAEKTGLLDYKIFEKNNTPGGLLRSFQHEGFTFDFTGHLLHSNDPYFKDFLNTVADINNFNSLERKAAIFSHNTFTDYPFQINLHGLPIHLAVECIEGYVSRPALKTPQNYYEWLITHFGKGFGKHFFFPYNSKILAYDLKKIHPAQAGRFVPSTNLEAIIKGTIEKKPLQGVGYNSNFYYPKKDGIQFLINQLCKQISRPVKTGYNVSQIDPLKKTVQFDNGHVEHYEKLITTMPLKQLLTVLTPSSRTPWDKASEKLLCNAVVNINLGFDRVELPALHWVYFPEKTFPLYRLGFWHNISASSVPQGTSAVYGEFSYLPGKTSLEELQKKTDLAIKKTVSFLKLSKNNIIAQKILHLDQAYVLYDSWHQENVSKILHQLQTCDIYSIGRYGSWKYSSMQEAVIDGKKTIEHIKNKFISSKEKTDLTQKALHVPSLKKKEFGRLS
jgi:protoporphyrinogen oxidase